LGGSRSLSIVSFQSWSNEANRVAKTSLEPTYHTSIQQRLIQIDNGGFHNSLNLSIPENVILLFQPAYSPEVNPIERLWGYVKEQLKWLRFDQIGFAE
jgi:transposase